MVATCPVCHEVVHIFAGYYQVHGTRNHAVFSRCDGSGRTVLTV